MVCWPVLPSGSGYICTTLTAITSLEEETEEGICDFTGDRGGKMKLHRDGNSQEWRRKDGSKHINLLASSGSSRFTHLSFMVEKLSRTAVEPIFVEFDLLFLLANILVNLLGWLESL